MADDPKPPEGQDDSLAARMGKIEERQDDQGGKLDRILGILSGDGKPAEGKEEPEQKGGSPGGIAHEIRAQLEERDRKDAASKAEAERDGTLADLKAKVAELAEKPPGPLPRKVEKIMGWT